MKWHRIGILIGVLLAVVIYLGFPERTGDTESASSSTPPTVSEPRPTDRPADTTADVPVATPENQPLPKTASADKRTADRLVMVTQQIAEPTDGRIPVRDPRVLDAMRTVPRHAFVTDDVQRLAYHDSPLPIGHGQTISQPYIVAIMTELLELKPDAKVLEIGTGSGYQAAVLARLTPNVYTIEIIRPLADKAKAVLTAKGYNTVKCRWGDGYHGWAEAGPFDGIIVTCAAGHLPDPLWQQLAPGGRIVIPIGGAYEVQRLVVIEKTPEGERVSETVMTVRFVPLTRTVAE